MDETTSKKAQKKLNLFGFETKSLYSWSGFVKLMNRPEDPSSLAAFRILFGIMMMIDIPNERGMAEADLEYGDSLQCYFPLFTFLKPFDMKWMVIIYGIMFLGALGITLGFRYRISCAMFVITYWYMFFLDKTSWNNHSYLYGLIGFMLLMMDGNRYLSIDGLVDRSIKNTHVPLWNYTLLRTQVFLVYFIAGLKKIDFDWIGGYSMIDLASHWVFDPFKTFLTHEQITVFIVHRGGLFIDLFVGYLMFFDRTRILGTLISSSFHIMNAQMFNIGMFPYTMLATTCIFYSNDWPKRFVLTSGLLREKLDTATNKFYVSRLSSHCIYEKIADAKSEKTTKQTKTKGHSFYHNFCAFLSILYISEQLFLPYSHFITKGYNNWTNGLYGYSWDMMIHSWHTQHIKISFLDKTTNQTHYLNPKAWTTRRRWSSHADMIKQYSECIENRLTGMNYSNIELYIDVWRSMNHRFNQRQLDPRVDMTKAKWNHFTETKWLMPLLTELSDWREKLQDIEREHVEKSDEYDLTFVADFNGLKLENYISKSLNASLEVLNGQVNVELDVSVNNWTSERMTNDSFSSVGVIKVNKTLVSGQKLEVPSGAYHNVYTISKEPSCFFYVYVNQTAITVSKLYDTFSTNMMRKFEANYLKISGTNFNETYKETTTWKAYNRTLIECSKEFLKIVSFNNSDESETKVIGEKETVYLENLIESEELDQIYHMFVEKFQVQIQTKLDILSDSFGRKVYRKIRTNSLKFKQSFKMVYYAVKSLIYEQDFAELVKLSFN